jgi:hypothetical protein
VSIIHFQLTGFESESLNRRGYLEDLVVDRTSYYRNVWCDELRYSNVAMVLFSNSDEPPGAIKQGLAVEPISFSWNTLSYGVSKTFFFFKISGAPF